MFKTTVVGVIQLRVASSKGQGDVCNIIEANDTPVQRGHMAASDMCAIDGDASMRFQIEHVS